MAEGYKHRVGERIREARLTYTARTGRSGNLLTQAALARLLPGSVDGPSISRWERGIVMPHTQTLELLAEALEVDVSYFLVPEPEAGTKDLMGALDPRGLTAGERQILAGIDGIIDRLERLEAAQSAADTQREEDDPPAAA